MFGSLKKIHMIGIGGIGMSALAKLFILQDKSVTGSDAHASDITRELERRGAQVHDGHDRTFVPMDAELVIHSPAVPASNPEIVAAKERSVPVLSYAQALGELSKQYSTIVVTGTHGKSTTTSMLGLILEAAGYDPTVIVGSFVPSFEHGNLRVGGGRFLVIEGCEHEANMLNLHPEMIVLTSIEADHLDFYKTLDNIRAAFQTFVDRLSGKGLVVVNADDPLSRTLSIENAVRYGTDGDAHYRFCERRVGDGRQSVVVHRQVPRENLGELSLMVPGTFNVSNALAAVSAAMELGVPFEICARALESFPGIWRRFERLGIWNGCELISDYGHHPTAIRVTLEAARELFPDKKLILCFQPHQHSRTQLLFNEFVDALSGADALVLPEIYRVEGRTEDESVSSQDLIEAIGGVPRPRLYAVDFVEAEAHLRQLEEEHPGSVIIIQGAGSIDELARSLVRKGIYHMKDKLQAIVGACFKENEVMAKHTNFRIGGPARWFVEVKTVNELKAVLEVCRAQDVPTFIFGGGSNTLVSDEGFNGIVIKIAMRSIVINGTSVKAEAGVLSAALARATAKAGLAGLTWAISLPGTVGGAVRGNAGCFGGEMKDRLVEAEVLRDGEVITLTKDELEFGYRESAIKHNKDVVLSATFELEKGGKAALQKELDEKLSKRKSSQPLDAGSAGCLFKNYEVKTEEELQRLQSKLDVPFEMSQSRRLSAGWLIDQLDLKGMQVGGAKISEKHGNFVVNTGAATSDDVVQLIAIVKTRARNELGIQLQEEVELVGFN